MCVCVWVCVCVVCVCCVCVWCVCVWVNVQCTHTHTHTHSSVYSYAYVIFISVILIWLLNFLTCQPWLSKSISGLDVQVESLMQVFVIWGGSAAHSWWSIAVISPASPPHGCESVMLRSALISAVNRSALHHTAIMLILQNSTAHVCSNTVCYLSVKSLCTSADGKLIKTNILQASPA